VPGAVLDATALRAEIARARTDGARVVLTNGVFDLLHVGHLRSLRAARALGDVLVVGVNADVSVAKPGRPLVTASERAELVAALDPVSWVTIFDAPTADGLLRLVRPDVYVKGGDYSVETLPEMATVREVGAELVLVPLLPGHSTTLLVAAALGRPTEE
jgi:rfaE bifunctional protein nucleotidyltransferase chain/domain